MTCFGPPNRSWSIYVWGGRILRVHACSIQYNYFFIAACNIWRLLKSRGIPSRHLGYFNTRRRGHP